MAPEPRATDLVTTTLTSSAIVLRDGRIHATANHAPVAAGR
ncbi:hypothetical protein [Streptomyces sp. MCA2]|nr:hypothetical protein [Streptomyces sp. MCA2]